MLIDDMSICLARLVLWLWRTFCSQEVISIYSKCLRKKRAGVGVGGTFRKLLTLSNFQSTMEFCGKILRVTNWILFSSFTI